MIGTIIVQEAAAEEQIQESEPVVEDIESEEPVVGINPNSSYQISDQIRSSELDNFKITLEDLRELWSWKNYKLISEKEYVNNAEGGIKKNVQSFYNNEGIWKSNVKLEIFQFDSYQNAKNYFEGHNYSNSEKYSNVEYSDNVCKQSPYEKGDMRGQRGLCHIENFVVKFNIDRHKDPLFANYETQELIIYLIKSESTFSNFPTFESVPLIKDTTIINEETVVEETVVEETVVEETVVKEFVEETVVEEVVEETVVKEVVSNQETSEGGGCLIATATYGSELAPQVQQLRELRDNQLLQTESGTAFMGAFNDIYYSFSPIIADYEREHPLFKEAVKLAITPMISSLSLMENAESESEVISLGLSVIMLNIGMYLGVPAVVIVGIRKIK